MVKTKINKIIEELKEKGVLHCEVRHYSRNPVKFEKRTLIHIEDAIKTLKKLERKKDEEIKGLKEELQKVYEDKAGASL